jgi:Uncharacterized conserved protein
MGIFGPMRDERASFFFDGPNFYSTCKHLHINTDYARLIDMMRKESRFVRASYYTPLDEDQEYNAIKPLLDWLDYNGYDVTTKATRTFEDEHGRRRVRGSVMVDIAVDMMLAGRYSEHIVLFSGDGNFTPVINALKRDGVRTTVISSISTDIPMISDELRRAADQFVDLASIRNYIAKEENDQLPSFVRKPAGEATVQKTTPRYAK